METEFRKSLEIKEKLVAENPSLAEYRSDLAAAQHGLGLALYSTGRLAEAEAQFRKAIASSHKAIEGNPAVAQHKLFLANHHNNLAGVLKYLGRPAEAESEYRKALAIFQKLTHSDPAVTEFRERLGACHRATGRLLLETGRPTEAEAEFRKAVGLIPADRDAASGVQAAARLAAVQDKLPALKQGDYKPATNDERLALAELCYLRKLYRTSASLSAEAFTADPSLADERQAQHRYNAACAAVLAASAQGQDEPPLELDEAAKAKLRKQAHDWLTAELVTWSKICESGPAQAKAFIFRMLDHWKQDPDLAGIRDAPELAKLTEAERKEWKALWADVDTLRQRAATDASKAGLGQPETRP
jgi:tetratricopeptide (TPR) repeat protein